jgi:UDP-N-acetylglucosamine 2-epimerase
MLLSGDTPTAIYKSMGLALIGYGEALQRLNPDMVVVLGDRFETFCMAAAAQVCRVPLAHIHGGETTEGAIDESFRHAITKMSMSLT